ncbi:hypothetical protein Ddye_026165 [Dipteronia dyeriana]|uniref:Uncharacterized protein n=1 Tax=Dipteronia dyeriana TaxID=168575 RepID=A0AAD9WQA2_9ROSI|nr:hypothetical protein Ddye_026165 [Dipteronia dyeriana]
MKWWQNMLFSVGGKVVLLKAIVQPIPTYAMSLFCLLKGLNLDIHRLCNCFGCGSTEAERKTHWCSWAKLCDCKENGGLEF